MANKNEVGRTLAKDLLHHHPGSGGGLNTHHHHHLSLLPNFLDTAGASASTAVKEDMSSPTTDSSIGDVQQQLGPSKLQPSSGAADLLRALSRYTTYFKAFWATQRDPTFLFCPQHFWEASTLEFGPKNSKRKTQGFGIVLKLCSK